MVKRISSYEDYSNSKKYQPERLDLNSILLTQPDIEVEKDKIKRDGVECETPCFNSGNVSDNEQDEVPDFGFDEYKLISQAHHNTQSDSKCRSRGAKLSLSKINRESLHFMVPSESDLLTNIGESMDFKKVNNGMSTSTNCLAQR